MSRVSADLLRLWAEDPAPTSSGESGFGKWWVATVRRSIGSVSVDDRYGICVRLLHDALRDTMYAVQTDESTAHLGLRRTMQALEAFQNIDSRSVPSDPLTFDIEDLQQALLLIAFQFDSIIGTNEWMQGLASWFCSSVQGVEELVGVSRLPVGEIQAHAEYSDAVYGYDALDNLDNLHWVIGMLEWLKWEDPRRNIRVDIPAWKARVADLERDLRPGLKKVQQGGVAFTDELAPARFWWRR